MRAIRNPFGLMATPAPAPADIAAEHADALSTLDFDKVIAALPDVIDSAMRTTLPDEYTAELAAQIAQAMIAELRNPHHDEPTGCPVYRDCTDTSVGHYDHYSHDIKVTGDEGGTILDIGMVALSGSQRHALVYLRNEEFTDAAAVHAKTAELRRLLDEADAMADRVFADHKAST